MPSPQKPNPCTFQLPISSTTFPYQSTYIIFIPATLTPHPQSSITPIHSPIQRTQPIPLHLNHTPTKSLQPHTQPPNVPLSPSCPLTHLPLTISNLSFPQKIISLLFSSPFLHYHFPASLRPLDTILPFHIS